MSLARKVPPDLKGHFSKPCATRTVNPRYGLPFVPIRSNLLSNSCVHIIESDDLQLCASRLVQCARRRGREDFRLAAGFMAAGSLETLPSATVYELVPFYRLVKQHVQVSL